MKLLVVKHPTEDDLELKAGYVLNFIFADNPG